MKIDSKLADEMMAEHNKLKICAVEDCMKAKRLLAGFGIAAHQNVLLNPSEVFDAYYDCDIEALHKELEALSAEASKYVCDLHFKNNVAEWNADKTRDNTPRFFRELGEDEMDKED